MEYFCKYLSIDYLEAPAPDTGTRMPLRSTILGFFATGVGSAGRCRARRSEPSDRSNPEAPNEETGLLPSP
jgi:hypothetical protein